MATKIIIVETHPSIYAGACREDIASLCYGEKDLVHCLSEQLKKEEVKGTSGTRESFTSNFLRADLLQGCNMKGCLRLLSWFHKYKLLNLLTSHFRVQSSSFQASASRSCDPSAWPRKLVGLPVNICSVLSDLTNLFSRSRTVALLRSNSSELM